MFSSATQDRDTFLNTEDDAELVSSGAQPKKASRLTRQDSRKIQSLIDEQAADDGTLDKESLLNIIEQDLEFGTALKLSRSRSRIEISRTREDADAVEASTEQSLASIIPARFLTTFEVTISKIFPAGFGWQGFSCLAEQAGYQATELPFFLMTGFGDGLFVLMGHTGYMAAKKALTGDEDINIGNEAQTGLLLGTAAFCSGTGWQPIVNALHDGLGLSFTNTVLGTTLGCGLLFYTGLRLGRNVYGGLFGMSGIEAPAYSNLKGDAALSVSIGAATGCFVGTDTSFVHGGIDQNWLRSVVGIEEGTADLTGMAIAGSSTAIGFTAMQSVQNVAYQPGKNWVD